MPEKTCPPHEWELECDDPYKPFGTCLYCDKLMSQKEIERRLNACEALSAEDARGLLNILYSIVQPAYRNGRDVMLEDYIRILGGIR